jgi:hypothetical protein
MWYGTAENKPVIWFACEEQIFLRRRLDRESMIGALRQFIRLPTDYNDRPAIDYSRYGINLHNNQILMGNYKETNDSR